jgi:hypothetical protein
MTKRKRTKAKPALNDAQLNVLSILLGRNSDDGDLRQALAESWSLGRTTPQPKDSVDDLRLLYERLLAQHKELAADDKGFRTNVELLRILDIAGNLERELRERNEPDLETQTRTAGYSEMAPWVAAVSRVHHAICVVEQRQNDRVELGTGFLVADDLVLTAWHVVEDVIGDAVPAGSVACIFDRVEHKRAETVHQLAPAPNVFHLAGAKNEMRGDARLPAAHELDFVLLRLAKPAGKDLVGDKVRGVIPVVADRADCDSWEHLLIVQHPGGELSKITPGIVDQQPYNSNKTRLRYLAKTDGGSSGAPCFTFNMELVAIHQARTDATASKQQVKQGVPITRIIQNIPHNDIIPRFWETNTRASRKLPDPISNIQIPNPPAAANAVAPKWQGTSVRNDAVTKFCLEVLKQARPSADFSASESYAKLDPAYGRFFWMADGNHELNEKFDGDEAVFYYEIWFKERGRAHLNVCDISIVWHREGERDKGGNAGIDGRMQAMAKAAQQEFGALLDAKRLAYARIDEIDGNLMVGIRRRLWDITDATGRQWSLETAVESVTKNVLFLRQQVESRLVRIIGDQPRGRPRRAKRTQ